MQVAEILLDVARRVEQVVEVWQKVKAEERELYEKRTQVFERIAMALEHDNEQKWHAVR